jgi:hypothetical protein
MEVLWPKLFQESPFASTLDNAPNASWYLIPQYSTCYYHHCVFTEKQEPEDCKLKIGKYVDAIVDYISVEYPYWNKTRGADHILIFPWDQASEVLGWGSVYQKRVSSCVHLSTLGTVHRYENHDPHKDVVIPPYANFSKALQLYPNESNSIWATPGRFLLGQYDFISNMLGPILEVLSQWTQPIMASYLDSSSQKQWMTRKRTVFGYFRGTIIEDTRYSYGVRQYLRELGRILPEKYHIHELHSKTYWEELGDAVFSFCPSGWSPWSPRLFDSVMAGAIPVIFADGTRLPFEDIIDYKLFAIKLLNGDVHMLDSVLSKVTDTEIDNKRNAMMQIRHHFVWNSPPKPGDAFYTTIDQLRRKRQSKPIGILSWPSSL